MWHVRLFSPAGVGAGRAAERHQRREHAVRRVQAGGARRLAVVVARVVEAIPGASGASGASGRVVTANTRELPHSERTRTCTAMGYSRGAVGTRGICHTLLPYGCSRHSTTGCPAPAWKGPHRGLRTASARALRRRVGCSRLRHSGRRPGTARRSTCAQHAPEQQAHRNRGAQPARERKRDARRMDMVGQSPPLQHHPGDLSRVLWLWVVSQPPYAYMMYSRSAAFSKPRMS